MKKLVLLTIVLMLGVVVCAQAAIDPSDPALRLWLKGDTVPTRAGTDFFGNPVTYADMWPDNSSYGTLIATQQTDEPALNQDFDNHTPLVETVTNNGATFQALHFRQAYDPTWPDAGSGFHYADRLYQQSNLNSSGFDPLDIGAGTDMTAFIVMNNQVTSGALGPWQTIFAKRGPSACPYMLGLRATGIDPPAQHDYITYGGAVEYDSGMGGVPQDEWGLVEMKIASEILTFTEFYDASRWGVTSAPQSLAGARNATVGDDTPFTIAFHAQGVGATPGVNPWGNGAYERFAGQIGEIIIYASDISGADKAELESYLLTKYGIVPEPVTLSLLGIGGLALLRRRR